MAANLQPHGTTFFAGAWDQGGEAKRPVDKMPFSGRAVYLDWELSTGARGRFGLPPLTPGVVVGTVDPQVHSPRPGQCRLARGLTRGLLTGTAGGGSLPSSLGLSLAR